MPVLIILLAAVFVFVKYLIGQDYFKIYLCFLGFPMMVAMCLQSETPLRINMLRKLILLFFIVECGLAIYEKNTGTNLFHEEIDDIMLQQQMYNQQEEWQFRSSSMWGHPLANAMIVSVFMSFIAISRLSLKSKISLLLLGYVSLWCFNARGATIVSSVIIMPVLLYQVHRSKMQYKKWIYLLLFLIFCYLANILLTTSLGGRIFSGERLIDGSAQTRLDVINFIRFISMEDLFLGSPDLYLFMTNKLQAGGVENGIITMILSHGIIITIIVLFCLFRFQYGLLSPFYTRKETFWLLSVFYIIGIMNPNLASPVQWTFWILCYFVFRDEKREKIIGYGKKDNIN